MPSPASISSGTTAGVDMAFRQFTIGTPEWQVIRVTAIPRHPIPQYGQSGQFERPLRPQADCAACGFDLASARAPRLGTGTRRAAANWRTSADAWTRTPPSATPSSTCRRSSIRGQRPRRRRPRRPIAPRPACAGARHRSPVRRRDQQGRQPKAACQKNAGGAAGVLACFARSRFLRDRRNPVVLALIAVAAVVIALPDRPPALTGLLLTTFLQQLRGCLLRGSEPRAGLRQRSRRSSRDSLSNSASSASRPPPAGEFSSGREYGRWSFGPWPCVCHLDFTGFSNCHRPFRLRPRAAGWSAATSCSGASLP